MLIKQDVSFLFSLATASQYPQIPFKKIKKNENFLFLPKTNNLNKT